MRKPEEVKKDIQKVKEDKTLSGKEKALKLLQLDDELSELFNFQFKNRIKPIEEEKNAKETTLYPYPISYKANLC